MAGSVAETALGLAWPQPPSAASPPRDPLLPTPAYKSAVSQYFPNAPSQGADCGVFVGIVMRASGADSNYPQSGTSSQYDYVTHSDKYIILTNVQSTADLQPGDIAILPGDGVSGHTFIYVGPQAGGYNEASASQAERMPSLGPSVLQDSRGQYIIARLK